MKNESINDVDAYDTFKKIELIDKGYSADKKYYIETTDDKKLLLRISDITEAGRKKSEFKVIEQASMLGIPMSQPLEYGKCNNRQSFYSMFTWCDGGDGENILPSLTVKEQYELGVTSGEYLKQIHTIPAPKTQEDWAIRFNRKIDDKLTRYYACGAKFPGDEHIIEYIAANRHRLVNRPQTLQHGDYHVKNMVISSTNELSIIDFNGYDYGDPWEEFNRIVWSASVSPHFASGQLNGYFAGRPPIEFFKLLALYISSNSLSSIAWAIAFGEEEVTTMKNQVKDVLHWFDKMDNPVPSWYMETF